MDFKFRPRPEPGTTTTKTVRYNVCGTCGYLVEDSTGLCDVGCPDDGNISKHRKIIHAVYNVRETFLRDE